MGNFLFSSSETKLYETKIYVQDDFFLEYGVVLIYSSSFILLSWSDKP